MAGKPDQEPSIEEILASIRQIISDDDAPRESDVDLSQKPDEAFVQASAPSSLQNSSDMDFDDVLELTNEIQNEPGDFVPGADDFIAPAPMPEPPAPAPEPAAIVPPAPRPEPAPQPVSQPAPVSARLPEDDVNDRDESSASIFSNEAASATTQAFSKLVGNIPVEREENKSQFADGRITLEDIARDLLRPILRDWIDQNVPRIVERLVEKELEKLSRQARD